PLPICPRRGDGGHGTARWIRLPGTALWNRMQPLAGGVVRAHDARAGEGAGRREAEERLILDSRARLVYRRRRFVAVGAVVFFVVAAGFGSGVASHLDPYG